MIGVPMSGVKSVTMLAMVHVGSRYEESKISGISHFLEHFLLNGTKKWPSAMAISQAIDGVGGTHNAFTGKDYTGYYIKLASDKLELAVDMVSDWLLEPLLPESEMSKEKGVILEEINMYEDDPKRYIYDVFDRLVYGDSSLGRDVIGTRETVSKLKRMDLLKYLQQWYGVGNMVVGIAGDASKLKTKSEKLKTMIEEYFSKGEKRVDDWVKRRKGGLGVKKQNSTRLKVIDKKIEGVHFHLGFPSFKRKHKDKYALRVLATILGGNSSARLFREIREKRGWAYYAYSSVDAYDETGAIYALEGVRQDKAQESVKVTLKQFEQVAGEGKGKVTSEEVERAKEYLKGKLALFLEDSGDLAQFYLRRLMLYDEIKTPEEIFKELDQVSREDVVRVAKKLFVPEKANLAIIGKVNKKKLNKLLR